jgi:non-specific serine/threonine protein kinase
MLSHDQGPPNSSNPSAPPAAESAWFAPQAGDLPSQPTALIGRERELDQLRDMLARPAVRLLTLTGAGGTGKTRLAIELAAERCDAFQHGCVFVDLAVLTSPALVPTTLAAAVGLRDIGTQPLLDTLKAYLRDRQVLAVLDNFEHLLEAAPLLPELLAASTHLRIIVTSRAALRLWRWEHEFAVAPLAVPDPAAHAVPERLAMVPSVALFVERARARRADFSLGPHNASAIADLCARLDGLPLALELAAAGVKVLSPQAILEHLERRLDLPGQPGDDFPVRHHTLHAVVGWSYDLLAPSEQALLRRLAVFAGGFSAEAAESICADDSVPTDQVQPLIGRLVDQSLVVAEEHGQEVRYRLLELIRAFALQQAEQSDEAEWCRRRHAEWCLALGLQAASGMRGAMQSAWLDRLELEHDNLRHALEWMSTRSDADIGDGQRLAAALWQFWWLRGYLSEGRRQLERTLAPAEPDAVTPQCVNALLAAGILAFRQGDYAAATEHLEASLAGARSLGDHAAAAAALRNLGRMAVDRGKFDEARLRLRTSLDVERSLNSLLGTAWSLNYLGLLEHFAGDNAAARAFVEQSLPMLRALGDTWGIAVGLAYLGRVASDDGDPSAAEMMWQESLETCRVQGYLWCVPYLLEFLGGLAIARGLLERGMRLAGAAEALRETIGAPLPPVWHADRDRDFAPARRRLDASTCATALDEGRRLTLDQAIAEASGKARPEPTPVRTAGTSSLTPREREVAMLVARGLTNRQIGDELVISSATAERHVVNILNKLGFHTRSQLAAWVVEQKIHTPVQDS